MKSRGVYETPGGTILQAAHRGIESLTLDRGAMHLKDELMPRYAELIYNGFWFAPEREMLQALIDKSQEKVEGPVRLKLYKGAARVVGRKSPNQPLQPGARHLRGGPGLRPARRRRLHQAQRAAPAPRRKAGPGLKKKPAGLVAGPHMTLLTARWRTAMRRGIYRVHGKDGQPDDVRVEDDGIQMPLAETLYISRGYLPRVTDLPWQENYVVPKPPEAAPEPIRAANLHLSDWGRSSRR